MGIPQPHTPIALHYKYKHVSFIHFMQIFIQILKVIQAKLCKYMTDWMKRFDDLTRYFSLKYL